MKHKSLTRRSLAVVFSSAALVAAIAILPAAVRAQQLTSFSDTLGEHLLYVNSSGHVLQLYGNTSSWSPQDLTSISGATIGAIAPGRLSSFYDTSGEHVFYMGSGFHIYRLYLAWGSNWVNQDLTTLSQATNVASPSFGASASMSDIRGEHVFYVGSNYDIYQLYMPWNGSWQNQDLTANSGGLPDYDGNLAAFADSTGEHVLYMDDNLRHVHQLYWSWTGTKPVDQDLTGQSSGAPLISSGLTAFYDAWGEHAIYPALVGGVVHIDQLFVPWGKKWVNQDLTATNNGHVALDATPLTSYTDVLGESVYYLDTNEHVNELFAEGDWANEDLTVLARSTTTAYTICPGFLTSFSDEAGDHVFYIGNTDQNVHQFYRDGLSSVWADQNLTQGLPAGEQPSAPACLFQ